MRAAPACVLLACASVLVVLTGCARQQPNRLAGFSAPPGMHSVFVAAHGYHTGLVFRARDVPPAAWPARRDFPEAEYLALGWGEREYYPHDDPGVALALRALFTPARSTINVISIAGPLEQALSGSEIVELHVSADGFARMVEFVAATHDLQPDGRASVIPSGPRQPGRFYASGRTFHALENCNVWVARALQAAGFPVHPKESLTAGMLLRQVRRLSPFAIATRIDVRDLREVPR